jgi:hypothetical protein
MPAAQRRAPAEAAVDRAPGPGEAANTAAAIEDGRRKRKPRFVL